MRLVDEAQELELGEMVEYGAFGIEGIGDEDVKDKDNVEFKCNDKDSVELLD